MKKYTFKIMIILAILAVTYGIGAIYFSSNIMPKTTMYSEKITDFTNSELEKVINQRDLTLLVKDKRNEIVIPMKEIDFKVENGDKLYQEIVAKQNNLAWPIEIMKNKNYDIANIVIDEKEVAQLIKENDIVDNNKKTIKSKDAFFEINEESKKVEIVDEIVGDQLDSKLVASHVMETLAKGKIKFKLDAAIIQPNVFRVDLEKTKDEVEYKIDNKIVINIPAKDYVIQPTKADKLKWVSIDYKENKVSVDKKAILIYLKNINKEFNKKEGKSDTVYRVSNGNSTLVKKGKSVKGINEYAVTAKIYDAMKNNYELNEDVKAISISKPRVVYEGHNSIDSNLVEVSIPNQKVYLYVDGKLVLSADVVTGKPGSTATPVGKFSIMYKTTNFTLRGDQYGYDYELPVSYWLPLEGGGGVGLHDAPWRSSGSFGGSLYLSDGSHGCINMRLGDVSVIYNNVVAGTGVWVH